MITIKQFRAPCLLFFLKNFTYFFVIVLEKLPEYHNIFHSLDVWHKACKVTAKLSEVGKRKKSFVLMFWFVRKHNQRIKIEKNILNV